MAKKTKSVKPTSKLLLLDITETEAGIRWLNRLPEPEVRDRVLVELFCQMKAAGVIENFENIHGRNDKGVDFIVASSSAFGGRVITGIQVKSKPITRSESSGALSAIRIREECHSAVQHNFHFQGREIRIDSIEVWSSAAITEDAEKELNPPHTLVRVGLKKDRELFSLVKKFCPLIVSKVPQLAITRYISESRSPSSKSIRILGCNLNPKSNFIEPYFSSRPPNSMRHLKQKGGALEKSDDKLTVQNLISETAHCVIFAPPLSGRSYLLEHLKCLIADKGKIPVLMKSADFPKSEMRIESLIASAIKFVSPKQVADLQARAGFVLLIDDLDKVPSGAREKLFELSPAAFRIVGTARSLVTPPGVKEFHFRGVDWLNIVKFLRSLDNKLASGKPFVDRARVFIDRTFNSSGLPKNPFTISVMLAECQQSSGRFSTPTMGRVIERFIFLQLGSHTEYGFQVDFETKRDFLTRLAGHTRNIFSIHDFERLLGKHINSRGHPHSITDFSNDLLTSGVFRRNEDSVEWSHPVIKEFFWVKNLVSKRRLKPIVERLQSGFETTLAALVGSQLEDGAEVLSQLLPKLEKKRLPSVNEIVEHQDFAGPLSKMISDQDEEELLVSIETEKFFSGVKAIGENKETIQSTSEKDKKSSKLTPDERLAFKKKLEPIMKRVAECELNLAFNASAILLNARDTDRETKEKTVDAVISICEEFGQLVHEFMLVLETTKKAEFLAMWLNVVMLCSIADEMLGDPHLVAIFRQRLKYSKSQPTTIALLDLLLCCGEEEHALILAELEKAKHLGVIFAFYWRVAMLYFFRHHRDKDRGNLRKLLSDIRRMERKQLPKLV